MTSTMENCTCILHTGQSNNEDIKPFDTHTWQKVVEAKMSRLFKFSSSKYLSICDQLPDSYDDSIGYHTACYKNFTAVTKSDTVSEEGSRRDSILRSDSILGKTSTSSGILPKKCIFCNLSRKKVKGKEEKLGNCETREAEKCIKDAATNLEDSKLLAEIGDVDFVAKEVKYHHSCRKLYLNKAMREQSAQDNPSDYSKDRILHTKAFSYLENYINVSVIQKGQAEFMTSIYSRYMSVFTDLGGDGDSYTLQKLTQKILTHFNAEVKIEKCSNKVGTILCQKDMDTINAIESAKVYASSNDFKVTETALLIRSAIQRLRATSNSLPYPVTPEALKAGQADPPEVLKHFFTVLFSGTEELSDFRVERYVHSASQDAIFMTTRGRVKPSKHLCLGLGLKSLTGSRKVIELVNHFGHSVSYHTVEELETDLAKTVTEKQHSTPYGLAQQPGLATSVAFDNYDENSETLSGAGTLHDTVGICFQNIPTEQGCSLQTYESNAVASKKRKRSIEMPDRSIEPYRKRPKIQTFQYETTINDCPANLLNAKRQDALWMISHYSIENTPM